MISLAYNIINAPIGKVCLFSIGQAGFILKSASGKLLGIDLYLSDYSEKDEGHIGFKRMLPKILGTKDLVLDYLVATHPHSDHYDYDSMYELMDNNHTKLFASVDCERLSESLGIDCRRTFYVKPDDYYEVDDFHISFVNCDHGVGAPDAVGVLINVNGINLLEVGDTCLRLDRKEEYLSKGPLDVLIAPINGAYGNLNEEDCAKLSSILRPKLTIPCHYGMFASHYGLPGLFMQHMEHLCPNNNYLIMTQGECIAL